MIWCLSNVFILPLLDHGGTYLVDTVELLLTLQLRLRQYNFITSYLQI
jgi:hypothetical protein